MTLAFAFVFLYSSGRFCGSSTCVFVKRNFSIPISLTYPDLLLRTNLLLYRFMCFGSQTCLPNYCLSFCLSVPLSTRFVNNSALYLFNIPHFPLNILCLLAQGEDPYSALLCWPTELFTVCLIDSQNVPTHPISIFNASLGRTRFSALHFFLPTPIPLAV